ncbi:formate--tetrahydrofolate ligase [Marinitoga sp. 1135]|uniref:Formate--tetrahydrofolate ligase n=1 Tax=Marinitoga piezophila (strain DSM 14283 / JCM 11233 / KA3) TaxID=443254 RepID=H2J727_MARPK|nr:MULTISPECIES: formate--tetrahydrofolate ligase [Marinitoga]AEX86397.1 formyltetrahydrofolate synthetase [Marinitoga piezophila KA3]APT76788.1 formate--tetrahydrofolate ligase [Marinitoga sp. 1137]NUU96558.1 formate--tetrahydrofolate ligase [Marinitoga sp. 1135]NUU98489.1 formate--tetrahydrofolate ligase [Marinitoga sp. 1138]
MLSDIEIARKAKLKKITEIAKDINIKEDYVHQCGNYIAKISHHYLRELKDKKDGKLILVTAINPTPAGEGKTTTSIGLSMAINKLGKKSIVTLREPSLGPVMGVKGGAAGGGYSQVLPMEDINLHFTGDIHAVTTAHNLVSAVIDAHIKYGNDLDIDETRVFWKRAMDMNDRALRQIVIALGGHANGNPREDGFIITAASEIMAVLCLAEDIPDLKRRLQNIVVARTRKGKPVTIGDLKIEGALAAVLKNAIDPNLVQTIENTPAFIHGGPFANIAHGTNSLIATKMALKLTDYVVTESGFGADLGAEKFLDFVSPTAGFKPDVIVLVATVRALKYNGGTKDFEQENMEALRNGIENLRVHIENLRKFGIPVVVALNRFSTDTDKELEFVIKFVENLGVKIALNEAFAKGSEGALDLAKKVLEESEKESELKPIYNWHDPLEVKIMKLAKEIYRASHVDYEMAARNKIKFFKKYGYDHLPVIVAKTQYSISDDPKKLGAPSNYNFTIRDFELSAGAGFIVALAGEIMRMPGLPKVSNAVNLDVDADGNITGLF